MTNELFNKILLRRQEHTIATLDMKSDEYAPDDSDRLQGFKDAARKRNTTPEDALRGIAVKQDIVIDDMVSGKLTPTMKMIDGRIGDAINYLHLLEGLLVEKYNLDPFYDEGEM